VTLPSWMFTSAESRPRTRLVSRTKRKKYWLRHLFILETNEEGRIIKITSFWDNATWCTQLGKTSLE
jgi:hypothetical protein